MSAITGGKARWHAAERALATNHEWYHAIDLAAGLVTPGHVDLRRTAAKVLPADLTGKRALDVGTFDGFWAFELEKRGAQVVAIDLDDVTGAEWPPHHRDHYIEVARERNVDLGRGFRLAAEALGSSVRRVECDVYDLTPADLGGPVDIAFIGALLVHLRDPVKALERVRDALAPAGDLYLLETVCLRDTLLSPRTPKARFEPVYTPFNWWRPNALALRSWLTVAGFSELRHRGLHRPPQRRPMRDWFLGVAARAPL
jgi:tRNA (mo5U34)-methyltransferase